MDWLSAAPIEVAVERVAETLPIAPTNPSSLTLTLLGVATLVVFGAGRRALQRRTLTRHTSRDISTQADDRRAA